MHVESRYQNLCLCIALEMAHSPENSEKIYFIVESEKIRPEPINHKNQSFSHDKSLLFASPLDKWNLVLKGEHFSIFIYIEHAWSNFGYNLVYRDCRGCERGWNADLILHSLDKRSWKSVVSSTKAPLLLCIIRGSFTCQWQCSGFFMFSLIFISVSFTIQLSDSLPVFF